MSKMKDIMIKILNDPKFTGDTTEYMEKIKKYVAKKKNTLQKSA
jgi:hypothetical protein